VERRDDPHGARVYDVYRGNTRVAWGLGDRAAAERWMQRLGGAVTARPPVEQPEQQPTTTAPRRAWWSEHE
jgi:hypothetical protein